jgi:hypothetical protein
MFQPCCAGIPALRLLLLLLHALQLALLLLVQQQPSF